MKVRELIAHLQDDIDPESEIAIEFALPDYAMTVTGEVQGLQFGMNFAGGYTATLICR
jgi:hypothetical protein